MPRKTTQNGKIEIRMSFKGEEAQKFRAIRRWKGIQTYTELIRVLVSEAYERFLSFESKRREIESLLKLT